MKIFEAMEFAAFRDGGFQRKPSKDSRDAASLAKELFAEAEWRGDPFIYHTPDTWRKKWLPSQRFYLMRLPLNAAASPCDPRGRNLVLKKIHAREDKPIIVDYNRNQVGRTRYGYVPQVIVIDGKHRFEAAHLRGDTHIAAWVGELAAQALQAFGSGGGPAPERTTPASGSSLVAKGKNLKARGGMQDAKLANRAGTTYSEGTKLKELNVDKVEAEFQAACAKGYKPKMHAVHPPGCEDAVQGLKKKYGDSDSTYKIAWWMKDQGRCG